MKASIITGITAIALIFALTSPASAGDRPYHRQGKQIKRITGGVQKAKISNKEYYRLNKEQRRIQRFRRHAMADGRLSRGERQRLHRMQEKADRHIYRAKHNRRVRHRPYPEHRACYNGYPRPGGYGISGIWAAPGWGFSISTGGRW